MEPNYGYTAEVTKSKYDRERDLGFHWTVYVQTTRGRSRVALFGTKHDAENVARLLNEQVDPDNIGADAPTTQQKEASC